MTPEKKEQKFNNHPIQLLSVVVNELFIKPNQAPSIDIEAKGDRFSLGVGIAEYDEGNHRILVGVKLEVGAEENSDAPFNMRIEIVGQFEVDEERFLRENIDDWANRNAVFILFPYLREHAYSLSSKCGFAPMILPLLQVPTSKK